MTLGVYRVTGQRAFRGHEPGETFTAKLEERHEARAIHRGSIELLERIEAALPPEWALPEGWADAP